MKEMDNKNKASIIVTTYLAIYFLGAVFITLIFSSFCRAFNLQLSELEMNSYINLIVYLVLFGALLYITFNDLKGDFNTLKEKKGNLLYTFFASYGIFYVINLATSLLISNIDMYASMMSDFFNMPNTLEITSDNQSYIQEILQSKSAWAMILAAGFIGPICEEIVFRHAIFKACKTKEMGIIISSLVFGMIHVISSLGMYNGISIILMTIPYVISGMALSIVYVKNDCNIWVPTIVHMLSNIISILGILALY